MPSAPLPYSNFSPASHESRILWHSQFAVPSLERLLEHPAFSVLASPSQTNVGVAAINAFTGQDCRPDASPPVWQPQRVKKTLTELKTGADVFVVVAYGQILSQEILDMPQLLH